MNLCSCIHVTSWPVLTAESINSGILNIFAVFNILIVVFVLAFISWDFYFYFTYSQSLTFRLHPEIRLQDALLVPRDERCGMDML